MGKPVQITEGLDAGAVAHLGNPIQEQRDIVAGRAWVELSSRAVIAVSGSARAQWLHDLTTAHFRSIEPQTSLLALVLDANGRAQYELHAIVTADSILLITEQQDVNAVLQYLQSMRFLLDVDAQILSARVVGTWGPAAALEDQPAWSVPVEFATGAATPAGSDRGGDASKYTGERLAFFPGVEYVVLREDDEVLQAAPGWAGVLAWEALRIGAGMPRIHSESDAKTLPHEVGWVGPGVHLDKGCYRGQEAVARTHNMGRPPRRLVQLLLADGENLPIPGSAVTAGERTVGQVLSVTTHYELGPIATALVRRNTPEGEVGVDGGVARTINLVAVL